MNVDIKVDTSKFDKMLADIPAALARAQRNALEDIGAEVKSEAEQAFRHPNLRPSPWAPRKPTYIVKVNKKTKKKTKKLDDHPLLIKSGVLWQSIDAKEQWPRNMVVVGTDKKYASYHQTGTKNMPARPFFPVDREGKLTPRAKRKIDAIVENIGSNRVIRKCGGELVGTDEEYLSRKNRTVRVNRYIVKKKA
jgi:phage gpG-like protein